jgi:hypothetical protein
MYDFQKETTKALEYYNRTLAIHEESGNESIGWAITLTNIGVVYVEQRRLK